MRPPHFAAARQFDQIELMRDNLAQPRGPEGSPVDAIEMVDRLLFIAGRRLRVRRPVASSVNPKEGVLARGRSRCVTAIVRLQFEELALRGVHIELALRQMLEVCLTTASLSGWSRSTGI
jgi:hypothetical protein